MSRHQGDAFMYRVVQALDMEGVPNKITKNSGAVNEDGDIHALDLMLECKSYKIKGGKKVVHPKVDMDELDKAEAQAFPLGRLAAYAVESSTGKAIVAMSLEQFAKLMARANHGEEN